METVYFKNGTKKKKQPEKIICKIPVAADMIYYLLKLKERRETFMGRIKTMMRLIPKSQNGVIKASLYIIIVIIILMVAIALGIAHAHHMSQKKAARDTIRNFVQNINIDAKQLEAEGFKLDVTTVENLIKDYPIGGIKLFGTLTAKDFFGKGISVQEDPNIANGVMIVIDANQVWSTKRDIVEHLKTIFGDPDGIFYIREDPHNGYMFNCYSDQSGEEKCKNF